MKKILSAIIALALCASVAVGASGCGCEKNKKTAKNTTSTSSGPGYKVEPTNPDFEEGDFGFYRLNDNEVKVTVYNGKDKAPKASPRSRSTRSHPARTSRRSTSPAP